MVSKTYTGAIHGINGLMVCVEADVSDGLPEFSMVGALANEVREAKERVRIALKNSGYRLPPKRITVNLSPADMRKQGTTYDLAIAISILAASGFIPEDKLKDIIIIGELSLDGRVNRIEGILPIINSAFEQGFKKCIVPKDNAREGAVIEKMEIIGVDTLEDVVMYMNNKKIIESEFVDLEGIFCDKDMAYEVDFEDISGQEMVKRAVEVAVAGNHNILMIGPPGSGKTMIARRIPTIMPNLTFKESMEISKVYSVSGMLDNNKVLMTNRPFRAPHHTITQAALTGGGNNPKPGEISLASGGVLFLDELPEFNKNTLEILRQPLEEGEVTISRLQGTYTYPANMILVCAMNPCNCGFYPDRKKCNCSINEVNRYLGKISKPLLDRIDICVEAPRIEFVDIKNYKKGEASKNIRERIMHARKIQEERFRDMDIYSNSQMSNKLVKKYCKLTEESKDMIEKAFDKYNLSARMYFKILKVARTLADLEGNKDISKENLMEALCYRTIDKKYW